MQKYKKKLAEYEDKLKKYDEFDYNAEADELLRLQRAQLEQSRSDGVSDVLARYAANTGMGGSSAAMAAAQQTASKYDGMIADALTAAEEKAYSRWAAERADLESKIASTKQAAYNEAAARLSLGDLSGYQGLGYDTSAYEAQAQAQAQAQEQNTAVKLGGNGMTEAEYTAEKGRITAQISSLEKYKNESNIQKIDQLYVQLTRLNKRYFSTPRDYSDEEIEHLLADMAHNNYKVVSYPEYLALVKYFEAEGGEQYVKSAGITYSTAY